MLGMIMKANMLDGLNRSVDRPSPWWAQLVDVVLHMCKPSEDEALCVCTEDNGLSPVLLGISVS